MKHWKKAFTITLALVMAISTVSILGAFNFTRTITVHFIGCNVSNDKEVISAINARLRELGFKFRFKGIWDNWTGDRGRMALDTGDRRVDITFAASWGIVYPRYAQMGAFVRLDDPRNNLLEHYGREVREAIPSFLWDSFTINGKAGRGVYAVPGYKDYTTHWSWDINNSLLAELGYNIEDYSWDHNFIYQPAFEEMLAAAKTHMGDHFYPFMPGTDFIRFMASSQPDPTGLGVLHFGFDTADPSKPENIFGSFAFDLPVYQKAIARMEEFYKKGYIDPRLAIRAEASQTITEAQNSANYLFCNRYANPGFGEEASAARGIDVRIIPMVAPFVSTDSATGSGFGISIYSRNQREAMQFLNALYTDQKLATIIAYGVEGIHHVKNNDGTVTLTDRRHSEYIVWPRGVGNYYILPPLEELGPDFYSKFRAENEEGIPTAMNGFHINIKPFETELAALQNVSDEFISTISIGAGNPAMLKEFKDKLNANGLQRVITEINNQLRAFYKEK
jgi:putative aldouronate transport system substrate-binding protein